MSFVRGIKRSFSLILVAFLLTCCFFVNNLYSSENCLACGASTFASSNYSLSINSPFEKLINWLFPWTQKEEQTSNSNGVLVYVGGYPLGFTLECEGVVIVGTSDVLTQTGAVNPTAQSNILAGDVLTKIENETVYGAQMIEELINNESSAGKSLTVEINRNGMVFTTTINPALDVATGKFKLGLWIRDNAAGVGTLSYVRQDNNRFGALGHPVCDIDTGAILPIDKGSIYACNIIGVSKGERGKPGELRGLFLKGGEKIGSLDNNTNYGVFGVMEQNVNLNTTPILTASRDETKIGDAQIRCTVDGTEPQYYDIEIIKINKSNSKDQKNMVIRITDEDLLNTTGGIVQGMSGSPIIQNNKLIGVVTHVFVSDPTKGFGTFIDNMINS